MPPTESLSAGSEWRRWDPHIHAPGTLLNDQFDDDWEGYVTAIESATPAVQVLGVTDYYSIASYQAVRERQKLGRLPGVALVFPNVELRLEVATERKQGVNVHLLFSPDDPNHEQEIQRLLAGLTFEYQSRQYRCTPSDLADLGRAHNPAVSTESAARREGANQFKVTVDQLRQLFRREGWAAQNCIVAVSASSNDGTAGLKNDSGFAAWRKELERLAGVIFSATPSVREFWLGNKEGHGPDVLDREYGGLKACLHGSDAHRIVDVARPADDRCCWIKGDATFESLRQALLEPEERVWIGPTPHARHDGSVCVASVGTQGTAWLSSTTIPLNTGLVAIIGSRGSGKTALADLIAAGAGVRSPYTLDSSFLHRASTPVNYLRNAVVTLRWGDGRSCNIRLSPDEPETEGQVEGVRYLSQQFVEQLCSAEGLAIELRREIERVIFNATDPTERLDADSFDQLAEIHLTPIRHRRRTLQEAILGISAQVVSEDALHGRLEAINREREALMTKIARTKTEMQSLLPKGNEELVKRMGELESALNTLSVSVDKHKRVKLRLVELRKEIERLRATAIPQWLNRLKADYHDVGLGPADWEGLTPRISEAAEQVLADRIEAVEATIRSMTDGDVGNSSDRLPLDRWPLNRIRAERDRLQSLIGIEKQKKDRYGRLRQLLEVDERSLQRALAELAHANGANDRKKYLVEQRRQLYADIFATLVEEQEVLARLYAPLQTLLQSASGTLNRLRFSVRREIDVDAWVRRCETLLDLRRESRIRGHGGLKKEAERLLIGPWKFQSADQVAEAMQTFVKEMLPEFRKSMPATIRSEDVPAWLQQLAAWVYSTDHIQLRYSITYDDVAIEHLSPGTRGIVLLLLYLVLDKRDQRPLIIDQPEENLDPKSVFDELVPHFREVRRRRQVIIVTHNANLVVNTDADQVIVASSERKAGTGLPQLSYLSGSLENPQIRHAVCAILEGGEKAFLDRERRYRLR